MKTDGDEHADLERVWTIEAPEPKSKLQSDTLINLNWMVKFLRFFLAPSGSPVSKLASFKNVLVENVKPRI